MPPNSVQVINQLNDLEFESHRIPKAEGNVYLNHLKESLPGSCE